jgi:transposase
VTWSERRLIVRSFKQAQAQEAALRKRLTKAEAAIAELSVRRKGKKRMTSLAELESATDDILKRFSVEGLISIKVSETIIKHFMRSYGNIPARTEKESIFCETQINETVLKNIINRLGWRVYATQK